MKNSKILSMVFGTLLFFSLAGQVNAQPCPIANEPCPMANTPCIMEKTPCPMTQPCTKRDECPDVSSCPMVEKCSKRMQEMIGEPDTYSDQRFIRAIIMHKQVEIKVAQDTLQQIQNDELKKEAKYIIDKDKKQIRKLQATCRKIYGK